MAALGVVGTLSAAAMAGDYDSPSKVPTVGDNTLNWTGQGTSGGELNTEQCSGDTPEAGDLLWIFTTDAATLGSPDPVLHLGGSGSGEFTGENKGGSWHFLTHAADTPSGLTGLTAYVAFNVAEAGNGDLVLTISHGCPGGRPPAAGLSIAKDAAGSYDRECGWTISKSVDSTSAEVDAGQSVVFNYKVTVSATCDQIKNVEAHGTITVTNPNGDPVVIGPFGIVDTLSDGTVCVLTPTDGAGTLMLPGPNAFNYSCDLDSALPSDFPATTNTATVDWPNQPLAHYQDLVAGSATTGPIPVSFTETLIDNCVDVTDTLDGVSNAVGSFCVYTAAGGSHDFLYQRTFYGPPAGTCADHKNKASFADNSTPQQVGESNEVTVRVCSFGPRLTPGYWKNHLAPTGSTGCSGLPSGTSCNNNGPWANIWANATQYKVLGTYQVNSILKAAQVFVLMNCSNTGSNAAQNQNAIGCLAGHLLAAKYNRNINNSNPCIDTVIANANAFLASIPYTGPSGNYSGISIANRNIAIGYKNSLDAYNNGGYCH